jgi:hypothetical protein
MGSVFAGPNNLRGFERPIAQVRGKGDFTMFRKPFARRLSLAGTAAVGLAGCPVFAAIGHSDPTVVPGQTTDNCAHSTKLLKQLVMIDNATDGSYQCLGVTLDGDMVKAIRVETHSFASAARQKASERIKIEDFSQEVIESSHGAVLDGVPGHDAIIVHGHIAPLSGRSQLVTTFLYNGFTGEYHSCQITLDRAPDTGWRLVNSLDQPISHIMVKTREIPLIGTYGIATLEGACG